MSKNKKTKFNTKLAVLMLAAALLIGGAIGGTVAWLTDTTDAVKNTFTIGNIDIELAETKEDFKMIPGCTIEKDPVVTVLKGSEKCYLFIKIEESENLDDFIEYTVDTGWTALTGVAGVYYRVVESATADQEFGILADDKVTVKGAVTKDMMDGLTEDDLPTLTFTAYACQYMSGDSAFAPADAWSAVNPSVGD